MGGGATAADGRSLTEADIMEDVPSGSRQLSTWLRRTRQNKVRKVVREVYLRDDIVPDTFEGADQILIMDTNIALHQVDFIAEDACVNHVVVPYTVLQEVRNRHRGTYARLRSLCRVDAEDERERAKWQAELDQAATQPQKGGQIKDMSSARNARRFYVFPNEFFRETYVERRAEETPNDRNDRAIRRVAHWYRRHVAGPEILLLTDDRACRQKAVADGLAALTAREFVERMKQKFPDAGEKLAFREEEQDGAAAEAGGAAAAVSTGTKRALGAASGPAASGPEAAYPPHLKASEVESALKERRLFQGTLKMHMNTCSFGTVLCGDREFEVAGRAALNRAIDQDVVVVRELEAAGEAPEGPAAKRPRREAGGAEPGAAGGAPSAASGAPLPTDRPRGEVVGIVKRNWREYCGTLKPLREDGLEDAGPASYNKTDRIFIPSDARLPHIKIQTRHSSNLENKRIVVVLDSWDRYSHFPRGHWTKILGDVGDRAVESMVILHEHGVITREFGEAVLRCLPPADWTPGPEDMEGREDLRGLCVCSVDPPGCKDIDDAVHCELLPNGNFSVGVHIADVTHFVHPDTAVDKEAAERCTTVYLVERRTDMLPGLLTTDVCSLRGGVERVTFSVIWEMTPAAEVVTARFCKALIKSRAALSYAEAQGRIDDPGDTSQLTLALRNLNKLTKIIRARRMENGALELASQEMRFELDSETQDPTDVAEYKLRETNKLIEELMLLANQAVAAKILDTFPMFGVLRRHPPPKDEALKTLKKLLAKHGFDDFRFESNKELGESLSRAVKPEDPYFNQLVRMMTTRCMNQALYFCTGEVQPHLYGHYGLAMKLYTHFTSPIRRYADVLVHRLLAACLGITPLPEQLQSKAVIKDQCEKINVKHHMAQCAGRASSELHTFMYFNGKGEKSAEAVVTRIRRSGMQVTVPRYGIDGVVAMPEADWDVDEEEQRITSKTDVKVRIGVFNHIAVRIQADNSNFRNRTQLTFERLIREAEQEAFEAAEESRKKAQKEMFPDRLVQEAN